MRRMLVLVLGIALVAAAVSNAAEQEDADRLQTLEQRVEQLETAAGNELKPETIRVYWKNGLKFDSNDGEFKFQIGGRIYNDWLGWSGKDRDVENAVGSLEDGTEFRAARLFVAGTIYKVVKFKAQYDFAGGDADFKDVYVELITVPYVGNVKVGHFKEPMGLEELTSSRYVTFMERALPAAFLPSRNTGVMLHNTAIDDRLTWAAGVFRDSDSYGNSSGGGDYAGTARVTFVPWSDEENNRVSHVGVSYSLRSPQGDMARFRQRPEMHQAAYFVDTGTFASDDLSLVGLEAALVLGPCSIQGEYMMASSDASMASDPEFDGWYIQVSHFLTGEHRPYKKGKFGRVKPNKNFMNSPGPGAWEIAARYSTIDLSDSGIGGGELDDITLGLNWYLNPHTRVMWNYVHADLDDIGDADGFQMRLQIDF